VPAATRGWGLVGAVALILFVDYFLYGVVIPLTPHAPAGVKSEDQLGFLYATYAASVLVVTPFFGYLGDRLGARFMLLAGVGNRHTDVEAYTNAGLDAAHIFIKLPEFSSEVQSDLDNGRATGIDQYVAMPM